jgi:HEPN domain-containing protein
MNKSRELARLLLHKAAEDEFVMRALLEEKDAPEAPIGFHAQQAVEKAIKAVLAHRKITYPRTHDVSYLLRLLDKHGVPQPPEAARLVALGPYAAELRYGEPLLGAAEGPSLDRKWVAACVEATRAWAEKLIQPPA